MPCKWCGSSRHNDDNCSIQQKHQALLDGASIEEASFDVVFVASSLEGATKQVADFVETQKIIRNRREQYELTDD